MSRGSTSCLITNQIALVRTADQRFRRQHEGAFSFFGGGGVSRLDSLCDSCNVEDSHDYARVYTKVSSHNSLPSLALDPIPVSQHILPFLDFIFSAL